MKKFLRPDPPRASVVLTTKLYGQPRGRQRSITKVSPVRHAMGSIPSVVIEGNTMQLIIAVVCLLAVVIVKAFIEVDL